MARLEKKMIHSEVEIKLLFKNLPIPTFVWQKIKADLILIDYNIAAEEITKENIKNLLGTKASQVYKDNPEILNNINRCINEQVNFSRELDYTLKTTGETKSFHVKYSYIPPDLVILYMEDITARKNVEEELRLYNEIMTNMSVGINIVRENDGIIVYTNPQFEEIFGYNPGELIGKHVSILNAPISKSREEIVKEVTRLLKKKGEWEGDIENIKKDGTVFWCHVHVSTFKHPEYDKVWVAVQTDITERKKAEKELRESEMNYKNLLENLELFLMVIDRDEVFQFVNKNAAESMGGKPSDFIGKSLNDIFPKEVAEKYAKMHQDIYKSGKGITFEHTLNLPLGSRVLYTSEQPVKDLKGNNVAVQIISLDITEPKITKQKLEESEKKLNLILSSANDAIVVVSKDLKILFMNKKGKTLFGEYKIDEMCYKILMKRNKICEDCTFNKLITNYQPDVRFETHFRNPSTNEDIYLEFNCTPIFNFYGQPAIIDIIRDITERKKNEEAIREGERFLSNIFHCIQDGICIIDKDYNILRVNPALEEWYSHMMPLTNKKCYQAFKYRTKHCEDCATYYTFKTGQASEFITPKIGANKMIDGWLTIFTFPLFDNDTGKINAVIMYIRNITSQKQAEEEMKNTLSELDQLFNTSVPLCVVDKNYNHIRVNDTFNSFYNLKENEVYNKKCYEIRQGNRCYTPNCTMKQILSGKDRVDYEIDTELNDGRIISYIITAHPYRNPDGEIIGIIENFTDITVRKKVEQKIKESEKKYRSVLENIKEGYFEVDLDGNFTFFNDSILILLGYSRDELMGNNYSKIMDDNNSKKIYQVFSDVFKTEISLTGFQYEIIKKNREKKIVETSIYLRYDSDGKKIGFYGFVGDITEKIKAEKMIKEEIIKLKELDNIKNEFVYRASHELKTPLNSICSASTLLLKLYQHELDSRSKGLVEIINKGGERLESLIKNLLDLSRIESGKLKLTKRKVNIVEIIKECVNESVYLIEKRELSLKLELPSDLHISVDKIRIEQVLMNLLSNALKYTPPEGIITISLEPQNDYVDIKIKDTGVGFTTNEKRKIFKQFGKIERYGMGMNIDTEGSGLGLYLSKEIVNAHNGIIWVESKGRNKGSTFIIRLPLV